MGDYEHKVLIGAVLGGGLFNLPFLPAKPSTAGSLGRGGARERAQFSPSGGNGDKRTLRRRAAMGKVTRRPQAAKLPAKWRAGSSRPTPGKRLFLHRPLIRPLRGHLPLSLLSLRDISP